jgi:hypothetical protein
VGLGGRIVAHAVGEVARAVAKGEAEVRKEDPTWWWVTRGLFVLFLIVGSIFILWQNRFHIDAPVVVMWLGFLAVLLAVANLWRLGAAAVAPENATADAWTRPLGERAELEKEKKTLLKSIKEAEFDQAMGKLSKHDAEELIHMYRARAIELIKELDRLDAGQVGTPRERIEREVAARLAVEQEKAKAAKKAKADGKKADKADAKKTDKAKSETAAETKAEPEDDAKGETIDGAKAETIDGAKADDAKPAAAADGQTAKSQEASS